MTAAQFAGSSMQHAAAPAASPSSWSGRSWTTPPCLDAGDDWDTLADDLTASLAIIGLCTLGRLP